MWVYICGYIYIYCVCVFVLCFAEPVSATLLYNGMPISAGKDGCVCLWDAAAPNSPLVVLEAHGPVHAMQVVEARGALAGGLTGW
jgi:hypothetical protein